MLPIFDDSFQTDLCLIKSSDPDAFPVWKVLQHIVFYREGSRSIRRRSSTCCDPIRRRSESRYTSQTGVSPDPLRMVFLSCPVEPGSVLLLRLSLRAPSAPAPRPVARIGSIRRMTPVLFNTDLSDPFSGRFCVLLVFSSRFIHHSRVCLQRSGIIARAVNVEISMCSAIHVQNVQNESKLFIFALIGLYFQNAQNAQMTPFSKKIPCIWKSLTRADPPRLC